MVRETGFPAFERSSLPAPRRCKRRGYTLAALMIYITILMIGFAVGFQLWSNRIQRENEEELIFRGRQYTEAIRLFKQRNGRAPTKLEELMQMGPGKPRCIRHLWKDPMTPPDGKWGLIFENQTRWPLVVVPGTEGEANPVTGAPPGLGSLPQSSIEIKPFETTGPGGEGEAPVGPIAAVFSTSVKESLRSWNGRKHYCEWDFRQQVGIIPMPPQGGQQVPPGGNPPHK